MASTLGKLPPMSRAARTFTLVAIAGCFWSACRDLRLGDFADASVSGAGSDGGTDGGPTALHVLFIGDSYTYVNDLPGMLSQIAQTAGIPPTITTAQAVIGGATLEELWDAGGAEEMIDDGGFTHVVLQGQSGEPLTDPSDFVAYAQKFESLIVDAGARPTLFVTWARAAGDPTYSPNNYGYLLDPGQMQDEVTAAYDGLARQWPHGLLACAGEAFRRAITQYPAIALQQSDFSHPTVAGTYLAACTFYVALTGRAVPAQSAVPAGLDPQGAASLREVAQIGSACADVEPKAFVLWSDHSWIDPMFPEPDGGLQFDGPFDYGTAGTSIPNYFVLVNWGAVAADLADGLTLSAPFAWAGDGGYPGGSGTVLLQDGTTYPFCGSSLGPTNPYRPQGFLETDPPSVCVLAVSYTGAATGSGLFTINLTNAYESGFTRELQGTSTSRALLQVSEDPGYFGCTDATCSGDEIPASEVASVLVSNRGALATESLSVGAPLVPPVYWGPSGGADGGAFPGGSSTGSLLWDTPMGSAASETYGYCTSQTLAPGQQCLVTVSAGADGECSASAAVNLVYSDALGPISPNANRNISLRGPGGDAGCRLPP
jgi:hypothetical protein